MKSFMSSMRNMQLFSILVGMAFGAAIGLILFCYLVPHGPRAIAMLRHYTAHMIGQDKKNKAAFRQIYASSTQFDYSLDRQTEISLEDSK